MGEELLGNPLDILNKEDVFDSGLTIGEVVERAGIKKNSPEKDKISIHRRIVAMYTDGLISPMNPFDKSDLDPYRFDERLYPNIDNLRIRISANGFNLLNNIRIKKVMEDVTSSLEKTNASVLKLQDSIEKFDASSSKSSFLLIVLTIMIAFATIIQIAIALKWI